MSSSLLDSPAVDLSSGVHSESVSSDLAVRVRNLSKSYNIVHNAAKHTTASEALMHRLRNPLQRPERETFWALQDINFDIQKGDVVGIIGRNGAGKSTLLKILSRITEPTTGQIDLYGRVGSLLEIGTGFHPELTGRENIFLNGAILGMKKREIASHFDAIVDFAGVEQFLDTQVKRYSSGMYIRLAFSIAAHLNPEILIVDEVLAVGDSEFQKKCMGKMQDVAKHGRTVIFVSHQMQAIQVLCNHAMLLNKGRFIFAGDVSSAMQRYLHAPKLHKDVDDMDGRPGTGECRFTSVTPSKDVFFSEEDKVVTFAIKRINPLVGKLYVSCLVVDANENQIVQCDSRMVGHYLKASDCYRGRLSIRSTWLKPGQYTIHMFICNSGIVDHFDDACKIVISPLLPYSTVASSDATASGIIFANFSYDEIDTNLVSSEVETFAAQQG